MARSSSTTSTRRPATAGAAGSRSAATGTPPADGTASVDLTAGTGAASFQVDVGSQDAGDALVDVTVTAPHVDPAALFTVLEEARTSCLSGRLPDAVVAVTYLRPLGRDPVTVTCTLETVGRRTFRTRETIATDDERPFLPAVPAAVPRQGAQAPSAVPAVAVLADMTLAAMAAV